MIVGILQPGYLPWLGFFEQMYRSDVFVIYDDVQYDKHGWRNRNRIKTANGIQWLTVPVLTKGLNKPVVKDVRINNSEDWAKKHLSSLKNSYGKADYFEKYFDIFDRIYSRNWDFLIDINMEFINSTCRILGMEKRIEFSSELGITGDKVERLINICKAFDADVFYEGSAGRNYLDEGIFREAGIEIEFQDYVHPAYKQLYGEFVPYLSVVDLLFNEGDKSLSILVGSRDREIEREESQ